MDTTEKPEGNEIKGNVFTGEQGGISIDRPSFDPGDSGAVADKEISGYSIGPFQVDMGAQTVTLHPGVYTFREPVTFPYDEATRVEGVHVRPLDVDGGATCGGASEIPAPASRNDS